MGMDDIPTLANGSDYEPWVSYELDWGIPTFVQLGPGMEVLSVDEGQADPGRYMR